MNRRHISALERRYLLIATKASIIAMLTLMAVSFLKTAESIATPCSVNAYGKYLLPPFVFVVPKWNLNAENSSVES